MHIKYTYILHYIYYTYIINLFWTSCTFIWIYRSLAIPVLCSVIYSLSTREQSCPCYAFNRDRNGMCPIWILTILWKWPAVCLSELTAPGSCGNGLHASAGAHSTACLYGYKAPWTSTLDSSHGCQFSWSWGEIHTSPSRCAAITAMLHGLF